MLGRRFYGAGAPGAQDLVHDVILRLRSDEQKWADRDDDDLLAYAMRVLHNLYIDTCHRKRRELLSKKDEPLDTPAEGSASPEEQVIAHQELARQREALARAASSMTDEERRFLMLSFRDGAAEAQRVLG
jgi:RNA polymerase sigma factor (sigma-70 family)